jgi:proliferating cell nuclear antigen
MVDLALPSDIFQEYSCKGEHDICLGIDELTKISKRMAGDEHLEFNLDEAENRFEIKMVGQADRVFKLQLLKPPEDQTKKPGIEFEAKAEMLADTFKQAIKDIAVVSSHVKISAESDKLTFTGEGDTGEANVFLTTKGDAPALFQLEVSGKSVAMYALNYLSEISKAIASDSLMLQFTSNKPLLLEYSIAEAGSISFVLAPRVERRADRG